MCHEMRTDAELLGTILNEAPVVRDRQTGRPFVLSAKVLAGWTGRSIQTVSDYRIGKTNIPVDFWKLLLTRFIDNRILALFTPGDMDIEMHSIPACRHETASAFFIETLKAEREHSEMQQWIAEILADGQVDELDASTIQKYDDAYHVHRVRDAALHRGILTRFNRAMAAREVAS